MKYEIKEPVPVRDGVIDVKFNHPKFGWIPFTATADDVEAHGREIYEQAKAVLDGSSRL